MIRSFLSLLLACSVWGCTRQHYVIIKADTLTLYLQAPQATRVQFASSADQFVLHEVVKKGDGSWAIGGLANTEFQYFYLVDGKVVLPECRFRQNDDFGTANCRYLP
ncbi:MAG: hypothetical protein JZU50_03090 [Desulfobulbaceae bacterium]|jgi:hypothetical protein|nr:hypothetical protein [Desulfobulbaceae bacterium]